MKPEDVLVIGDSWSSAVSADGGDRTGWPQMLGIPERNVQAVAGSTAAQWAADFEGRLTRAIETPAECLVFSLLGNDMRAALADGLLTLDEAMRGIRALRRVAAATRRRRTIALLYADPSGGADPRVAMAAHSLNAAIAETLELVGGIELLDCQSLLGKSHFLPPDIHPTVEGHVFIARKIKAMLELEVAL